MTIFVGQIVAVGSPDQSGDMLGPPAAVVKSGIRIVVRLEGGERFTVDPRRPHAAGYTRMLGMLRHAQMPVYLETDDATGIVDRLLVPGVFQVRGIAQQPMDERLDVDLRISHARDFVAVTNPNYQRIVEALRAAERQEIPVLVTHEPSRREIIDVRPANRFLSTRNGHRSTEVATVPPMAIESTAVTSTQAQQMFDLVNAQTCPTTSSALACIPFLYPDQGCWARAHDMCRMMIASGVTPMKVWSYGRRLVATNNSPNCEVAWNWHAAPILGDTVIDPSLFSGPATFADWLARQPVIPPSLPDDFEFTEAAVYLTGRVSYDGSVQYDSYYASTNADLVSLRLQFANRCGITNPPGPPYQCFE